MIHVKDHKQVDMFHPFEHLDPKLLALLESSWAHLFREEILHTLPVEDLTDEEAAKREFAPTELLADSLYGSDENLEKAKELRVEVFSPAMGSAPEGISLADFTFSETDEMISCPQGQPPQRIKTGKNGGRIVHFDKATCDHCPRQSDCPVKRVKKSATLGYDAKSLRLARRQAKEKTEAFREIYRFRAGAEGTMSDLDRVTGIKHLRVRGTRQVRLAAVLKVTGLNILLATVFRNRQKPKETRGTGANRSPNGVVGGFKKQLSPLRGYLRHLAEAFRPANNQIGWLMPQAA